MQSKQTWLLISTNCDSTARGVNFRPAILPIARVGARQLRVMMRLIATAAGRGLLASARSAED